MAESEVKKAFMANISDLIKADKKIMIEVIAVIIIGLILIGGGVCLCYNMNDEWILAEKGEFLMKGTVFVSIIIICLAALLYVILYYYHNKKHRASKEYYDFLHHLVNAAMELEKAQPKTQEDTIKQIIKEQLSKETIEKAIKDAIQEQKIAESLTTTVQETIRKQLSTEKDNIAELIKESNAKIEPIETTLNQTAQTVKIDKLTKILNAIKGFFHTTNN